MTCSLRYLLGTLLLLLTFGVAPTTARTAMPTDSTTYKATYYNQENRIRLVINLYEEAVDVPGFSFIGPTHGYMSGNIYGVWIVTSCSIHHNGTATLHLSNDQGADSQTVTLTPQPPRDLLYEAVDGNEIKKVQGRKLVKIPSKLKFVRQ